MSGFVDLHCHYLPAIDDGVKTAEEGIALARGLRSIGYETVVATPHIRTAMFENRKAGIEKAFSEFASHASDLEGMPTLGLGAEHHFDDIVWNLFQADEAVPYPGGAAALVEFPERAIPMGVTDRFFRMMVKGLRPVLAHPERYRAFFKSSDDIDPLLDVGVLPLLDLMALTGKYGRKPKKAAERMVDEGVYYAACSDSHRPSDVDKVAQAIERLRKLIGDEEAEELLRDNPRRILDGRVE
ncbi:MAG: protein tyrosine phosphatase [Deltaproteobacteria bacterium]|nr:protein tyrosine phosphatase [Deltaproteobacteria bacterium]